MHLKKFLPYIVIMIVGIFLINLIASNYLLMQKSASELNSTKFIQLHLLATFYCFLLGILLEWRSVVKLVKKEAKISFSASLIPGIIILLISCISPMIILMQFGINFPFPIDTSLSGFFIGPLTQSPIIQNLLAVIAGSIIIKSLFKTTPISSK